MNKTLKLILATAIAVVLIAAVISFADTARLGTFRTMGFNVQKAVTKTTTYTALVTDSYIKANATSAGFTITLPAVSDATAGGTIQYKILKTDSSTNVVTVAAGSGDTIGGEASRAILSQNAYMIIHSGPGRDWTVDYETPYIVEDHYAGTYTTGIGSGGAWSAPTVSTTFTASSCGNTYMIATDALTMKLPAGVAGCKFTFINTGAAGNNIITITTTSSVIQGTIFSAAATTTPAQVISTATGSSLNNTKSTAKPGDMVELLSVSSGTWIITKGTGTWASI